MTDPRRPKLLSTLTDPEWPTLRVFDTARLSPDGNTLMVADFENSYLFDVSSPSRPRFQAKISTNTMPPVIAFSPDGRLLAISDGGNGIVL
ncbi:MULTISPECIES: YncE family protein [Protofrankia]|uniref:YncE family protein n=1 Tax=Protofrankia TaxID=2994361 RepID=UPI0010413258|nr:MULTISPECIES: WD40 repeat domain-containing protein [Protofrankia]